MGLLSKLGGAVKEGLRKGAVNGLLRATGNEAAIGHVSGSAYEYDANGHIKGVNSQYAADISNLYGTGGSNATFNLDMYDKSSSGLAYNANGHRPNQYNTESTLNKYPTKYNGNYTNTSYSAAEAQRNTNIEYNTNIIDNESSRLGRQLTNKETSNLLKNKGKETNNGVKDVNGLIFRDTSDSIKNYNKMGYANLSHHVAKDPTSDIYKLKLPDWSYADFINERSIWQKGLSSVFDEPGWFYFKIFFDFDTNHGLFGGLLNHAYLDNAINSEEKDAITNKNLHKNIKANDRINSLYKFASILSYINVNSPWYFKSVKGLNKVLNPVLDEFSKERYIEIETLPDAIDMRLSTLMSLYNYACYDVYYDKEIIPQNLRKFNMTIILFQTPLRYLHTSYSSHNKMEFMGINTDSIPFANQLLNGATNKMVKYKNMSINDGGTANFGNTMSMKVITLYGCEFDKESMGAIIPNDISNETPFQLGKNTIKITYTEAVEHTMNEFYGMMFGSDGFYFNQFSNYQDDNFETSINQSKDWQSKQYDRYKTLKNTFANGAQGGTILGIIDSPKSYKEAIDATESIMNGIGESKDILSSLGVNFALGLLGSSKNTNAPQGNLYGDYGIGSAYYKDKLEMLKNGVHERTTAPYYYDPYTGVRVDLHKSRNYTAYNFKNDVSTVQNFDLNNWLNTTSTDLGNSLNDSARNLFYGDHINTQAPYKPNDYNLITAQQKDSKRFEGKGKNHDMIDDPNTWDNVQQPYNSEIKNGGS